MNVRHIRYRLKSVSDILKTPRNPYGLPSDADIAMIVDDGCERIKELEKELEWFKMVYGERK